MCQELCVLGDSLRRPTGRPSLDFWGPVLRECCVELGSIFPALLEEMDES